ncbi:MAG: hypothetical protein HY958_10020 [Bacteroidia bacterium]|nr:hypothetical protein [Bacteroidia bacterium]
MMPKIFSVLAFVFFIFSFSAFSQQVAVGKWRDHLPYSHGLKVAVGGDKAYCVTNAGLFTYNKRDNSVEKLSKITGLSDVGVTAAGYNKDYSVALIGYTNGNLDLVDGTTIYNIPDIKNKLMPGNKQINNFLMIGNYAYISCGFGIVVVDLIRKEIKDTYLIGTNGDYLDVSEIAYDGTYIYAATENGIYKGRQDNPNLVNFAEWTVITDIPNGQPYSWLRNKKFNTVTCFNNKVYVNKTSGVWGKDTILSYSDAGWSFFKKSDNYFYCVRNSEETLLIVSAWAVEGFDSSGNPNEQAWISEGRWAEYDQNKVLWIADFTDGLIKKVNSSSTEKIHPKGPNKTDVVSLSVAGNKLWAATGAKNGSWGNMWYDGEVYSFINEEWNTYNYTNVSAMATTIDILNVLVNPQNPDQVFAGSWNGGVLEFRNSQLYKIYDDSNSTLQTVVAGRCFKVGGMALDQNNNLWISNPDVPAPFSVKTASGNWYKFNYSTAVDAQVIGSIIVTKNNHKWAILPRGVGLFAFDEKGTYSNTSDDNVKKFSILDEYGKVISNDIFSIAEDLNGIIWVGTNMGVVVYYNPENVFSNSNFYAQQIKVPSEIAGQANYLLETEVVTAIAVDGANRKWFGTESSGVFLMSGDGLLQINHFTTQNSPLLSNSITCISINGETGEVFFGTEKGIISYRGTATDGADEFKEVLVFPNPVKPDYTGLITVSGLVTNSNVKITDIGGNIVFETKAEGGQAVWNGKNFNGDKVHTGVYLVFSTNEDGSKTNITKLLFIN